MSEVMFDTPLYQPEPGVLVPHKVVPLDGGEVFLGHYHTNRAVHNVNVYRPDGFDPSIGLPAVLMATPLGTGTGKNSHNDDVAQGVMRDGLPVILKGVPHYHGPTIHALTLAEDANEMMGTVQQVERAGILGKIQSLRAYGESQSAMKGFAVVALQEAYSFPVPDGQLVAPCYMDAINYAEPRQNLIRLGGMVVGVANYVAHAPLDELLRKRGSFKLKDLHHHVIVIPVLTSGETGTFPALIDEDQHLGVDLFEEDWYSKPYKTQDQLKGAFPNMRAQVHKGYGHVTGIMSEEVRIQRSVMVFEAKKSVDVESAIAA